MRETGARPDEFRFLCSHFATGVAIVAALDESGAPCGMTANSFAAISLEPPLVSVAVDHEATLFPVMVGSARFTINILQSTQEALSRRFAAGLDDRFEGVPWEAGADGHVILDGVLAHLRCEKWAEIPAGDHTIFVGRVTGGGSTEGRKPLIHFRGGYSRWEQAP